MAGNLSFLVGVVAVRMTAICIVGCGWMASGVVVVGIVERAGRILFKNWLLM